MSIYDRLCDICSDPIPEARGVYIAPLRLFVHTGLPFVEDGPPCRDKVKAVEKDYAHSKRGRFRNRAEVWLLLGLDIDMTP